MSVINTNITSLIAQGNLSRSQSALQTSMERLSSGLRINSAKDDAAGQAIANRMTAQITGLNQAARNANDGISIAQTAEGSLNQVNDNLQRIRELAVQAANGTNSSADLQSIQDEINQRLEEINRISRETEFNSVSVLAEDVTSLTIQVGANDGQTIEVGLRAINVESLGLNNFSVLRTVAPEVSEALTGPVAIEDNGDIDVSSLGLTEGGVEGVYEDSDGNYFVNITGDTSDSTLNGVYTATIDAEGVVTVGGKATVDLDTSGIDLADEGFGANATFEVLRDDNGAYFIDVTDPDTAANDGTYAATVAADGTVTFTGTVTPGTNNNAADPTDNPVAVTTAPMDVSTLTGVTELAGHFDADITGLEADQSVVQVTAEGADPVYAIQDAEGNLFAIDGDLTTAGGAVAVKQVTYTDADGVSQTADVQLGGIDGVTEFVAVGDAQYAADALDGADLSDPNADPVETITAGATASPLSALDEALANIDSLRSELGAVQNRFEDAINNLRTNSTNLSAARSRIEDADYAVEVANMIRSQILQQAGTSVLAQANQIPQIALSLLG